MPRDLSKEGLLQCLHDEIEARLHHMSFSHLSLADLSAAHKFIRHEIDADKNAEKTEHMGEVSDEGHIEKMGSWRK